MHSKATIPTLLGLAILILGLAGGVILATKPGLLGLQTKAAPTSTPTNINIVNISDTSASVCWQTDQLISGFIQADTNPNNRKMVFQDDRDLQGPQNHKLHFVTLIKLSPNTVYYFKIKSGSSTYPTGDPLSFKTEPSAISFSHQPIIGIVLDSNLQPVDEAIITLQIPGTQKLATITKAAGNFILPLTQIKIEDHTQATLSAFNTQASSQVLLTLPLKDQTLTPITLGKDLDLAFKIASPTATEPQYDLNGDGVINSLDRSIVLKSFGPLRPEASKNPQNRGADLNRDGIVDQKDLDIIDHLIPKSSVQ